MRKISLLALGLFAAAVAFPAAADELSYTYAEVGYQHVDTDLGVDARGAYVRGSYEFGDSGAYLTGSYADLSNDGFDIEPRPASLGLGYHHSFGSGFDGLVEAAYEHTDTSVVDVEGWRVSAGVRGQFAQNWEGLAKVNFFDGADYASDTSGTLGVQYRFTPTWGVTGEVEFDGDTESYLVGVRSTF